MQNSEAERGSGTSRTVLLCGGFRRRKLRTHLLAHQLRTRARRLWAHQGIASLEREMEDVPPPCRPTHQTTGSGHGDQCARKRDRSRAQSAAPGRRDRADSRRSQRQERRRRPARLHESSGERHFPIRGLRSRQADHGYVRDASDARTGGPDAGRPSCGPGCRGTRTLSRRRAAADGVVARRSHRRAARRALHLGGDARASCDRSTHRRHHRPDSDHGRNRHRQGSGRASGACLFATRQSAVPGVQLHIDAPRHAGFAALRTPPGSLHRSRGTLSRHRPHCRPGHIASGRDRRHAARRAAQAAPIPRIRRGAPDWRIAPREGGRSSAGRDQHASWKRLFHKASSARTSTTA